MMDWGRGRFRRAGLGYDSACRLKRFPEEK